MSYGVTLYNVFIASPGDVSAARAQVRSSVRVWNEIHTKHRKAILFALGWETNSAPNMGRPAQDIINDKLLADADILVGVFWTRLGTPTEGYASGSVEEIERHIEAGKPTLLYFSEEPVAMASVVREEYDRLQEFKESCKSRGLYHQFADITQFAEDLNKHLAMHMNDLLGEAGSVSLGIPSISLAASASPGLSKEAKILLKEASLDRGGVILHLGHIGGTEIQVNGKNIIGDGGRREIALWEGALEQLENHGLVRSRGGKGQIFELTDQGYRVADAL
ncbi:DUF4062 domain-containing protein [Pseudomonas sp. CR3202]|uniref:DUF4062 domain-containing protein n=1 Tax=Pseudomonas sp. CR3202 TaxID=3351532 RepID=UPI003BF378E4